jgi:hypothetical protein
VENLVVEVGVVEEGLGGNAADVQAGTTEGSTLLDTGSLIQCDQRLATDVSQPGCCRKDHRRNSGVPSLEVI